MREVLDMTSALQRIQMLYQRGYVVWISFSTAAEKVPAKDMQWERDFGTRLRASQRQDRKERGLPTAVATSTSVVGYPTMRQLILMATPFATGAHPQSPWSKEQWNERPPHCGDYVLVHSPVPGGRYAWTWNLHESVVARISAQLTRMVKAGNGPAVRIETTAWIASFSMSRGVRGQIRKVLKSGEKLWAACQQTPWPGVDPDDLPFVAEFRQQL